MGRKEANFGILLGRGPLKEIAARALKEPYCGRNYFQELLFIFSVVILDHNWFSDNGLELGNTYSS